MSELQENIVITDTAISGKLKKVNSYPEFGDDEANSPGHYLALFFDTDADKIVTKVIGGSGKETDCTSDKFCVYRIKENTQKIEVKTTKGEQTNTKTYTLTGLTLDET